MPEWYHDFFDADYEPARDDLIALFRFGCADGITPEEAMGRIASESSVGTWTTLAQMPKRILEMRAMAYRWDEDRVWVAYPRELWEPGNLPQLLSGVAGNIFGMKALTGLRLLDLSIPPQLLRSYPGPRLGIPGLRRALKVPKRPVLATVPKPKLGWSASEHAKLGLESWLGGIDLIKDDENLTNQSFNRFDKRVELLTKARARAERETGEVKSGLINITAETMEMLRRLKLLHRKGWEYAMVDVVTCGFAGFQTVREQAGEYGMAIHAHRAMHALFTRDERHGMSMPCLAKLLRAAGADQLHTGTVVGKLVSPESEVMGSVRACRDRQTEELADQLMQDWGRTKPMFPVASGGLHPGIVPEVLDVYGLDVVVQLGGGVHGHPKGSRAGAEALRAVTDAVTEGRTLREAASESPALRGALELWGKERPV